MDRKRHLRNVAFGGAWSEQIAGAEALCQAMSCVEAAASLTAETDLRCDGELASSVARLAAAHPKGDLLLQAWLKALDAANPGIRAKELARVAQALRAGIGRRLDE